MKLNEILLVGGALVAALVLSKGRGLSSAYALPEITNPLTNIITKVKSEPIQKTTSLLENILPTPIEAPIAAPIILPTPTPINQDPLINRYLLAKFPQWNDLLNPNVNLRKIGTEIVNTTRGLGNDAYLRNIATDYFRNETV